MIQEALTIADLDNGDTMGYFLKGHHDWEALRQGVLLLTTGDDDVNESVGNGGDGVLGVHYQHDWWRCVPVRDRLCKYMFWPAIQGARGAFPVTCCYYDW